MKKKMRMATQKERSKQWILASMAFLRFKNNRKRNKMLFAANKDVIFSDIN